MYRVRLKLNTFPDSTHVEYYTLPEADESVLLSVICIHQKALSKSF
mgnify:CR=1 FL=1